MLLERLKYACEDKKAASILASSAVSRVVAAVNRGKEVFKAGGQASFTENVAMDDDMCDKKMKETCDMTYKYYRIDGKCNNIVEGKEKLGSMSSLFRR